MKDLKFDIQHFAYNGTSGNDTIENTVSSTAVYGNGGNDSIHNRGSYISKDGKIVGRGGDYVTIQSGEGKDTVYNDFGNNVKISGDAGDDYIVTTNGDHITINGGKGIDRITNYYGEYVVMNADEGIVGKIDEI